MATNRKAQRWLRGAAASALAVLSLVLTTGAPAHADGEVGIAATPGSIALQIGGSNQNATISLSNKARTKSLKVVVSTRLDGLDNVAGYTVGPGTGCQANGNSAVTCDLGPGQGANFQVSFAPATSSNMQEGKQLRGTFTIEATATDATTQQPLGRSAGSMAVTVTGTAPKVDYVPKVSGTVTDEKSEPLEGVKIVVSDEKGNSFDTTTAADGSYVITTSASQPLVAGELKIKATKKGYQDKEVTTNGLSGQPTEFKFSMLKEVEESAEESAPPVVDDEGDEPEEAVGEDGWGASTWIIAILGLLFVIGGIVAIVLLLKRGKGDDDDTELFGDKPPDHTPKAAQTGLPGVYDAGPRKPVMDAPTMIHNGPLVDDDDLARYGSGGTPGGFGPAYNERGNDAPTQMFDPNARGGAYGDAPRSGGPAYGGDQRGGYGQGPYDAPRSGGGAYGDAPRSGGPAYGGDQRGGYGQGPYDAPRSGGGAYGDAPRGGPGYGGDAPRSGGPAYGGGQQPGPGDGPVWGPPQQGGYDAPRSGGGAYGDAPRSGGPAYGDAPRSGGPAYGDAPRSGGPAYGGGQQPGPGDGPVWGPPQQGGYDAPRSGGGAYGDAPRSGGPAYGGDQRGGYGQGPYDDPRGGPYGERPPGGPGQSYDQGGQSYDQDPRHDRRDDERGRYGDRYDDRPGW